MFYALLLHFPAHNNCLVDDSWIEVTPEQLDGMLRKAAGDIHSPDRFDVSQMKDSMKAFVDNVSSYEGAEFPGLVTCYCCEALLLQLFCFYKL